jgi:hypothetical protein
VHRTLALRAAATASFASLSEQVLAITILTHKALYRRLACDCVKYMHSHCNHTSYVIAGTPARMTTKEGITDLFWKLVSHRDVIQGPPLCNELDWAGGRMHMFEASQTATAAGGPRPAGPGAVRG